MEHNHDHNHDVNDDDDDDDDVTSQVALAGQALLFHKSKGILHGTLYFDLDSGLHFTLFTIDFRTI